MDFYNQQGWSEVGDGLYGDTLFEDLRPVAEEYIKKCHRRLSRHLVKGKYFFDIASGPVQYAEYLAYSEGCGYRVCVDFSLKALEAARKRLGDKGIFILGDITNLPIKDSVMDGGVSLHTIYHVHRDKQLAAFTELYRILKPGARAAVVYSWGKYSRIMHLCEGASRLPRRLKRLAAKTIYRVLKPAKYRTILDLEAADKKAAAELYFDPYPYAWLARELSARMTWSLTIWRFLSVGFLRAFVPDNALGRGLLDFIYAIEEGFPQLTARLGQYPVILLKKTA
jgi:ubiquinone/menaquinone biosynthesis C-methylase UbiE